MIVRRALLLAIVVLLSELIRTENGTVATNNKQTIKDLGAA